MEYIIGVIVSLVVQAVKKYAGDSDWLKMAIVLILSIFASAIYYFVKDTAFWQTLLQILTTAGATYTFIIRRFE